MAEVFETDGNDSFAKATSMGRVEDDPFVRGRLSSTDIIDIYKFNVNRPTRFGVSLFSDVVDADLALFDSKGKRIQLSSIIGANKTETIQVDNLPVGDYFLQASRFSGSGGYTLSTNGIAITRAQMSVTVDRLTALDRFDTPVPFTREGEADFQIAISGQKSKRFDNRNDIRPNFTVTQDVGINTINPSTFIGVDEIDSAVDFDDFVDIAPEKGSFLLINKFDVIKDEVSDSSAGFRVKENQVVTVQGNGDVGGDARIQFRVNYDTFTSSSSSISSNTPVILGNGSNQTLAGQNNSGILCGEDGNDTLSGMGGNDMLCGSSGNDKLNGGTGRDISFGGAGRDTHFGSAGRDTFVLSPNSGVDVVQDFKNGIDKLGLMLGMNFEILDIAQRGRDTVIGVGFQRLAVLSNVKANQITAADFVTVDFTNFNGVEVPITIA